MKNGRSWSRKILSSLGLRLSLWIFAVIVSGFGIFTYYNMEAATRFCRACAQDDAEKVSDIIERSTHWAMLRNRKEEVAQIISAVAGQRDVVGVRIFDKTGTIVYSSEEAEVSHKVDLTAEACVSCHKDEKANSLPPTEQRVRIFQGKDGKRVFGLTNPIENKPSCYNASCHAHPKNQSILGVLDVRVSLDRADVRRRALKRDATIAAALIALLAALAAAIFIQVMVRRPVRALVLGTRRVAAGDLELRIGDTRDDEMGQLARGFDQMTSNLSEARAELTGWSHRLERRLQERTDELGKTEQQVVHMEKMASLGKLSATVAHELNNPLAGILNYSKLVLRYLQEMEVPWEDRDEVVRCVELMSKETKRSGDIVKNLLLFARRSGTAMAPHNLHVAVDRALMLVQHHLQMASVSLERELFEGDDLITCDEDQIQQAMVALFINGIQAMPEGGTLTVRTSSTPEELVILIQDTGHGVPADLVPHIFEPFFTTKEETQGTGLGLAVVYGIVRRHGGDIQVDSRQGEGARFTIRLPRQPPVDVEPMEPGGGMNPPPKE